MDTTTLKIDELNVLDDVVEYFAPMGISDKQKEYRVKKAMECIGDFLFMLVWIETLNEHGQNVDWESELKKLNTKLSAHFGKDAKDIVNSTTIDALDVTRRHPGEEYFFSKERAVNLGIGLASDVANEEDFNEAYVSGANFKTWHTIVDGRERESHLVLNGRTIPIDDTFVVGDSLMRFPRDLKYDPELDQVCNCRCWLTFK